MLKHLTFLALMGRASCAGGVTNYASLGDDWPTDSSIADNECAGDYQSPIDLQSNFTKVPYKDDNFFKHYEDLDSAHDGFAHKTAWLAGGFTTKISFKGTLAAKDVSTWKSNYFKSDYMNLTSEFKVAQFHFHALSEHTIDG